ncbi:MAG: hypothetical protein OXT65_00410 [Alphaproteobacteria bacterium]|nr:hypothetical protein [Alphaproteobacteria bacterium]
MSKDDLREKFNAFDNSKQLGSCMDPDTGRVLYRGIAGPGTIEFSYDPEEEEVINGRKRKIDMCR